MVDQLIDIKTDVFNKLDSDALATMLSPAMTVAIEDNIRKASNSNSNILAVYDTAQLYLPDITKQLTTSRVKGTIITVTITTTIATSTVATTTTPLATATTTTITNTNTTTTTITITINTTTITTTITTIIITTTSILTI